MPVIVSEQLWNQTNAVLKERSEDVKKQQSIYSHKNMLTRKLYCSQCVVAYYCQHSLEDQNRKIAVQYIDGTTV